MNRSLSGRTLAPFSAGSVPGFSISALLLSLWALLITLLISSCAPPPPRLVLKPTAFPDLTGWSADRHAEALGALKRSCGRLASEKGERPRSDDQLEIGIGDWRPVCAAAAALPGDDQAARRFFESWFTPYLATNNGKAEGLFTGYYEPELRGTSTREGRYQVPIYRRPDDLVTADLGLFREEWKGQQLVGRVSGGRLVPYETRSQINAGALTGKGLELLWVDDPIDAFFLEIQGSGRVTMDDGDLVRLGFAARNGRPYVAIGRALVKRGALSEDQVSMQAIRAWLAAHPGEARDVMETNPSFVFFRVVDGEGPVGAQGVALTPGRSLAVDPKFIPLGLPIWLETTDPLQPEDPLRRLVVAQDTGSAINGPIRGDLFWGSDQHAAAKAGVMKQQGRYFLLVPRSTPVS